MRRGRALAAFGLVIAAGILAARNFHHKRGQPAAGARALPRPLALASDDAGPVASLAGVVFSAAHAPIPGARVCATELASIRAARPNPICALTGAGGAYDLAVPAAAGGYTLAASAAGFTPGAALGGKPVVVGAGQRRGGLDIVLTPGGARLAGHVLDATGGPIQGATVCVNAAAARQELVSTETDAGGAFSIFVRPGSVAVLAGASGYVAQRSSVIAPNTNVRIRLIPESTASGVVLTAEDGHAVPGIDVKAVHPGSWGAPFAPSASTGADGRFVIHGLAPGPYTFVAQGGGWYGVSSKTYPIELARGRDDVVVAVARAARVTGAVVERSGDRPCHEGSVSMGPTGILTLDDPPWHQQEPTRSRVPSFSSEIAQDGAVRFDGVPPGDYHVVVRCADRILVDGPATLSVADRDLEGLRWKVDGGCGLRVHVVDESGASVAGVRFKMTWPAQEHRPPRAAQYITDSDGRYEFANILYPGTYTLTPDRGYEGPATTVALVAGAERTDATLRLTGQGGVLVDVRTPDGQPIDDVFVRAYPDMPAPGVSGAPPPPVSPAAAHRFVAAVALGGGKFRIAPISPGTYHIAVTDGVNGFRDPPKATVSVAPPYPAIANIVLDRSGTVRGQVVDDRNQPVSDVWVDARCNGAGADRTPGGMQAAAFMHASAQKSRAVTDGSGHFLLDGLEPTGTCLIRVERPFGGAATKEGVVPGTDVKIQLQTPVERQASGVQSSLLR